MSKADSVFERLADWVTIETLCGEFGQMPHSLRALISVQSRKRGITIERQRVDGITYYRIAPVGVAAE